MKVQDFRWPLNWCHWLHGNNDEAVGGRVMTEGGIKQARCPGRRLLFLGLLAG
jgi:hypothetical protein